MLCHWEDQIWIISLPYSWLGYRFQWQIEYRGLCAAYHIHKVHLCCDSVPFFCFHAFIAWRYSYVHIKVLLLLAAQWCGIWCYDEICWNFLKKWKWWGLAIKDWGCFCVFNKCLWRHVGLLSKVCVWGSCKSGLWQELGLTSCYIHIHQMVSTSRRFLPFCVTL